MKSKIFFPAQKTNSFFKKDYFHLSLFFLTAILYVIFCPTLNIEVVNNSSEPVFSLYTVILITTLYLLQLFRFFDIKREIRFALAGSSFLMSFLIFIWEFSPFYQLRLLGFLTPSFSTLIIFQFIFLYEIFRIKISQPSILLDIFFFLGLLPLEISIIGYISKMPHLYTSRASSLIGLSIPTMVLFSLYFIYIVLNCKNLITHRLVDSDIWSRKVILINWIFWALLIGQYSFYLQAYKTNAGEFDIESIVFVLALMLFIQRVLYFVLLKSILNKRFSLITLCAVSKKVQKSDGSWIDIESYLKNEHFIATSHSLCPEEVEKIKEWTKD